MKKKVLFADLDGTLITTISERTFPLGIWDMKFRFNTLDAIKNYGFECLYIVTNQGGIEKGFVDERHFTKGTISYILCTLEGCTYQEVGDLLHRRHNTIIHQERIAAVWMRNPKFNQRGAKAIETIATKYGYY